MTRASALISIAFAAACLVAVSSAAPLWLGADDDDAAAAAPSNRQQQAVFDSDFEINAIDDDEDDEDDDDDNDAESAAAADESRLAECLTSCYRDFVQCNAVAASTTTPAAAPSPAAGLSQAQQCDRLQKQCEFSCLAAQLGDVAGGQQRGGNSDDASDEADIVKL